MFIIVNSQTLWDVSGRSGLGCDPVAWAGTVGGLALLTANVFIQESWPWVGGVPAWTLGVHSPAQGAGELQPLCL